MLKKCENTIFYLVIFSVSIFIVFVTCVLSQYCCFWGDDAFFTYYFENESIFETLKFVSHGGGYIGAFLCKFLNTKLPVMLGLNPGDFICTVHPVIRGIFNVFVIYTIAKFSVAVNKSKYIFMLFFIITTIYLFKSTMFTSVIEINYTYYRYVFSLLFYGLFWLYIYKIAVLNENNNIENKRNIIIYSICGYILGTTVEIVSFSSVIVSALMIMHNLICKIQAKLTGNDSSGQFKLNMFFYIPCAFMYFSLFMFINSPGFKSVASERGMADIHITLSGLKEFISLYYNIYFNSCIIYWLLFLILFILFLIIAKRRIKPGLFSLFMLFSVLTVIFSLVAGGKTYYGEFFLGHVNIIFVTKILLLYPLLIIFDNLYCCINEKYKKLYFSAFAVVIAIISFVLVKDFIRNDLDSVYVNPLQEDRRKLYITEKIVRFYSLKNEPVIISADADDNYGYLYRLSEIYHDKNIVNNGYVYSDNPVEEFYKQGGTFSDYELEHIKFSRLFNEDFVLNKISIDEL